MLRGKVCSNSFSCLRLSEGLSIPAEVTQTRLNLRSHTPPPTLMAGQVPVIWNGRITTLFSLLKFGFLAIHQGYSRWRHYRSRWRHCRPDRGLWHLYPFWTFSTRNLDETLRPHSHFGSQCKVFLKNLLVNINNRAKYFAGLISPNWFKLSKVSFFLSYLQV